MSTQLSRRRFLQTAGALSASGLASSTLFGHMSAMAATTGASATDYKALVCIFLYGGNDAFNTVLPRDTVSWAQYQTRRAPPPNSTTSLILALDQQRTISSMVNGVKTDFGLHPVLSDVANLYTGGQLAILANVGPVKEGTNKTTYNSGDPQYRPPGLYSHNDQQSLWQSGRGNTDSGGWGGRFLEALQIPTNGKATASPYASINTMLQNTNFGYGDVLSPYALTTSDTGAVQMGLKDYNFAVYAPFNANLIALASGTAGPTPTNLLEIDFANVVKKSYTAQQDLASAMPQYPSLLAAPTAPNGDRLPMMEELQVIARMIARNKANNIAGRQVFFVRHDGYDTHGTQLTSQATLLTQLNDAIKYFHDVLTANTLMDSVTTFTASDFGRQLSNNGDGTDHGWGSHHFIMGGAVKGGQIYGRIPSYANDGSSFTDPNMVEPSGVMMPEVSVDQYAATLGTWMGLGATEIKSVLPNHFGSTDLGFMKAA